MGELLDLIRALFVGFFSDGVWLFVLAFFAITALFMLFCLFCGPGEIPWMSRHNHQRWSKEYLEWRKARMFLAGGEYIDEEKLGDEYRAWLKTQQKA
jgi:uncharacterized membrane protein